MSFFDIFKRNNSARLLKPFEPIVMKINALEEGLKGLKDEELKAKTAEFKTRLNIQDSDSQDPVQYTKTCGIEKWSGRVNYPR